MIIGYKKKLKPSFRLHIKPKTKGAGIMNFGEKHSDVVIIGAGIAGLAAAKTLKQNGVKYLILEASHRIGGRAHSKELSKNNWFDLGCSYLHNGLTNPFVSIADKLNFPINKENGDIFDPKKTHYFSNGAMINLGLPNPLEKAHDNLLAKIQDLKTDEALVKFLDDGDSYFPISCHLLTNLIAEDPDLVSSEDYRASIYDGPDYPVSKTFGNLIKLWGKDTRVSFNTKVKLINSEKPFIKLETSKGNIITKKVILTVSTGVLSSKDITFRPPLPEDTIKAISNLPMGTLNKIGLSFDQQFFSSKDQGWYVSWRDDEIRAKKKIGSFHLLTDGPKNAVVFAGGKHGKWLEEQGPDTMLDYAISILEDVFGKACIKKIQNSITTAWTLDPFTRGSYSYAIPGESSSRGKLSNTIEKKLYFAGEATESNHYGTAHGAYFSGVKAANKILADL